jgi:hypothetical protein
MNRVKDPNDIDAVLGAFFKSQVPNPWPAFKRPPEKRTLPFRPAAKTPRTGFVLGSRVALAASVALLMLCGWLLSGSMNGSMNAKGKPPFDRDSGTAVKDKTKHLFHELPPVNEKQPSDKIKSKLNLRQRDDGRTEVEVIVEPLPENK